MNQIPIGENYPKLFIDKYPAIDQIITHGGAQRPITSQVMREVSRYTSDLKGISTLPIPAETDLLSFEKKISSTYGEWDLFQELT